MELYYAIMNIVDYLALNKYCITKENIATLIYILDDLLDIKKDTIEDIADANDCGECHTWDQLIDSIREQFELGERLRKEN